MHYYASGENLPVLEGDNLTENLEALYLCHWFCSYFCVSLSQGRPKVPPCHTGLTLTTLMLSCLLPDHAISITVVLGCLTRRKSLNSRSINPSSSALSSVSYILLSVSHLGSLGSTLHTLISASCLLASATYLPVSITTIAPPFVLRFNCQIIIISSLVVFGCNNFFNQCHHFSID